jgi:hypothetical protein
MERDLMTGGEEEGERTIVDDQDENQVFFMIFFIYINTHTRIRTLCGWGPIFIIALYVIVLWREFNCVTISPKRGK